MNRFWKASEDLVEAQLEAGDAANAGRSGKQYGLRPRAAVRRVQERRHQASGEVETHKLKVNQAFHRYREELEKTNNTRVRQFVREIQSIVAEGQAL
jgi:hypothetical protein